MEASTAAEIEKLTNARGSTVPRMGDKGLMSAAGKAMSELLDKDAIIVLLTTVSVPHTMIRA